jgi:putative heme iron utilization protein
MSEENDDLLKELLTGQRVLALGVLVEGKPHVGLLPYALNPDFSGAVVHASRLARHTVGLVTGAPFAAMIHQADRGDADPLQLPRVTLQGTVRPLERGSADWMETQQLYLRRFPTSEQTFSLGDFELYELRFLGGRLVGGFSRATSVSPEMLARLARRPR